jgi:hypothetical protein
MMSLMDDGAGEGASPAQPSMHANRTFVAYRRRLDARTFTRHNDERDHSGLREVNRLYELTDLLNHRSLLEQRRLQVRLNKSVVAR